MAIPEFLQAYLPPLSTVGIGTAVLIGLNLLSQRKGQSDGRVLLLQLLLWLTASIIVIALIVTLPLEDNVRGQILSLLGVVLTAVIALSSTTFVSNAMAGVMLQATQPFRPGDFVMVNGVFGRVTHRALVHTRIQTETRDFTTLPNLLLVTHPITVLHREGTIIYADVSLGYDVHHHVIEPCLLKAATNASLTDPYVLITELMDHAVGYRIAGFLEDVKNPISVRSQLRRFVMDELHGADIEITSPSVVAQRQQPGDTRFLPDRVQPAAASPPDIVSASPDQKVFDRGEAAAKVEDLKQAIAETQTAIDKQQAHVKSLPKPQRPPEEATLARLQQKLDWLEGRYKTLSAQDEDD